MKIRVSPPKKKTPKEIMGEPLEYPLLNSPMMSQFKVTVTSGNNEKGQGLR